MSFTEKQVGPLAESLGIGLPKPKKRSKKQQHPWLETTDLVKPLVIGWNPVFDALCESHRLPLPEYEYLFDPWKGGAAQELCTVHLHRGDGKCPNCGATRRMWRFDYLFDGWLAVEREGAVWSKGRHTRGKGFIQDMAKYNEAHILGYVVLRFTPQQFEDGSAFLVIKRALGSIEV